MTPAEEKVRRIAREYARIAATSIPAPKREGAVRACWRTLVQDNPEMKPFADLWFEITRSPRV